MTRVHGIALFLIAVATSACGGSDTSPSSTTPTTPVTNEVLTGTVSPPVNGTLQSSFNSFVVAASGGSLAVTLTSAVETLPGGSLLTTVAMGLAIGTVTNGACAPIQGAFTTAQPGASPQLSTSTISAGTYCVQVSDVTNQLGPVSYAVALAHY